MGFTEREVRKVAVEAAVTFHKNANDVHPVKVILESARCIEAYILHGYEHVTENSKK